MPICSPIRQYVLHVGEDDYGRAVLECSLDELQCLFPSGIDGLAGLVVPTSPEAVVPRAVFSVASLLLYACLDENRSPIRVQAILPRLLKRKSYDSGRGKLW
jgi:hypothetical protein